MKKLLISCITTALLVTQISSVLADETTVNTLMKNYQSQGAKTGNALRGQQFWNKTFSGKAPFTERSCKSCHTANLKNKGEHVRTGKILKPLAPSINSLSLSKVKKVNKWFKRNCKWTIGKECSAQEKADILAFIKQQ
jgi:hypothetical protein